MPKLRVPGATGCCGGQVPRVPGAEGAGEECQARRQVASVPACGGCRALGAGHLSPTKKPALRKLSAHSTCGTRVTQALRGTWWHFWHPWALVSPSPRSPQPSRVSCRVLGNSRLLKTPRFQRRVRPTARNRIEITAAATSAMAWSPAWQLVDCRRSPNIRSTASCGAHRLLRQRINRRK